MSTTLSTPLRPHGMALRSSSSSGKLNSPALMRPDLERSATNSPWSRFLEPSLFTARSTTSATRFDKDDQPATDIKREVDTTGIFTLERENNPFEQSFSYSKPPSEAAGLATEFDDDQDASVQIINTVSLNSIAPEMTVDDSNDLVSSARRRSAGIGGAPSRQSSRSSSSSVEALSLFSGSTSGTELTNADLSTSLSSTKRVGRGQVLPLSSFDRLHQHLAESTRATTRAHYQPAPNPISLHATHALADSSTSILTVNSIGATTSTNDRGLFTALQHGPSQSMCPSTMALADIQVGPAVGGAGHDDDDADALPHTTRTSGRKRKARALFDDSDLPASVLEDSEGEHVENDADMLVGVVQRSNSSSSPRRAKKLVSSMASGSHTTSGTLGPSDAGDSAAEGEGGDAPVSKKEGKAAALERNRLAAIRSRQKKKERVDGLQQAVTSLTTSNAQMQTQALQLYDEVQQLRQMLSAMHPPTECQCKHVQGYLARERKGQGIPMIEQMAGDVLTRAFVPGVTDEVTVKPSSRDGDQVERWREQVRREKEEMERKGKKAKVVDESHAIPIKRSKR
ncbi:hypothetical protein OIV83_006338 [Microbotryomycetes sp. JL201]|nr:hypothetical protein OIV83_006338 [Microbotryomycetes sp. JL201]